MQAVRMRGEAWLLRGISSIPGELILQGGSLRWIGHGSGSAWPWQLRKLERAFSTPGFARALLDDRAATLFVVPTRAVAVHWPWYTFGGGFTLHVNGVSLRISLGRPANTRLRPPGAAAGAALGDAVGQWRLVGAMRTRGKAWKAAFAHARDQAAADGGTDRRTWQ
ncbi:MAG: hypothetical protein R3E87_21010 [Burkholderiaceae bacterium]